MESKKIYGFGIIGCGMISSVHAEIINKLENATLIGVADHTKERAAAFAERFGTVAFESTEALLADPRVEVVVICTPSGTHAELAVQALRAGCHVLVEKPLALTGEQIRALAASILARMDECGNIRIAEADRSAKIAQWRKIAAGEYLPARSESGVLEEKALPIANRGKWGDYVADGKAADGRALKLFNTHYNWCTMMSMSNIAVEPGRKYRLRVCVRVEKAGDGEAFWAGVYSKGASRNRGSIDPRTAEAPDGAYRWYDVLTWVPAADEYFWIAPGRFDKDGKSSVGGVYVDKIEFVPVNL